MRDQSAVVALAIAVVLGMLSLSIYRRRDYVRNHLHYYVSAVIVYVFTFWIASHLLDPWKALLLAMLVYLIVLTRWRPRHSRYISRRDRRKVIAEFERSGERYDPKKHEIDHLVPHSRGGMSTSDNLKVVPRARNRAKSAKAPWWDLLGK
jgi:hypothetical protein